MRVTRAPGTVFDDERRRLLSTFAAGAALAIERATLAEAALRAAVLSRSDELKSALLSSVSHDLRTPLAAIKGSVSSLLVEGTGVTWDDATRREFLEIIAQAATKLTGLVDNLLDAARAEAGLLRVEREPVRLERIAERVLAERRALAPRHSLELRSAGPELPLVEADPVRIEQVLANLVDNAIKYSPNGGPIVVQLQEGANGVIASVSDSGVGLTADQAAHVFERFYRGEGALARATRGVGLGLFICKSLVEAHGGRIWVESRPGQGTTFSFSLPTLAEPAPAPARVASAVA
jgi:two-component system sensor histidine kinase KdpD